MRDNWHVAIWSGPDFEKEADVESTAARAIDQVTSRKRAAAPMTLARNAREVVMQALGLGDSSARVLSNEADDIDRPAVRDRARYAATTVRRQRTRDGHHGPAPKARSRASLEFFPSEHVRRLSNG